MADPKPVLTFSQADADVVYDELGDLHASLDADPLAFGPKRLNGKVAKVRGMLDRCERIFLDVAQRLHQAKREMRLESTAMTLAKMNLFANDPETRAGRSVGDREAIATGKLKVEVVQVNHLELMVQDLEAVLMVVKAKRSDLRDTQGRLRDQIRLCQEEIGLGNHWGSKSPKGKPGPDLTPSPVDGTTDIDDLLGGVDGEIHLGTQDGDWQDPDEFQFEPVEGDESDETPDESETEAEPSDEPKADEPKAEEPKDEPEIETEDEPVAPEEALPSTSSAGEVDSFLNEPEPQPDIGGDDEQPPPPDADGLDIEEILSSFEKKD